MIVLDTNVLSEEMKPAPDAAVHQWFLGHSASDLFTTSVTEAEIRLGIALLPDGKRKRDLETAALRVLELFAGRILPFDSAAAQDFARIVADRQRLGRPIEDFDAQIAAITLSRGMTLATRNLADFAGTGVALNDPWIR
jgi:toxin FitB